MKKLTTIQVPTELFNRLDKICEDYNFFRNSLVGYIIKKEIKRINSYKCERKRTRDKISKTTFQIYVEKDDYDEIKDNISQRISKILEEVVSDYEKGIERYK